MEKYVFFRSHYKAICIAHYPDDETAVEQGRRLSDELGEPVIVCRNLEVCEPVAALLAAAAKGGGGGGMSVTIRGYKHEWIWDWPWEMVNLKDWFYMVNAETFIKCAFLHVRFLGLRSLWTFRIQHTPPPGGKDVK